MNFDSIVFDLDGTLWDTTPACAVAWNNVVARHNVPFREISVEDVRKVTGKPHDDCIRHTFEGVSDEHVQKLIEGTRVEDVEVINRIGGTIYDGVLQGIPELAKHYRLFIVSNCQTGYIENFLELTGLGPYFEDFECFGNTGQPKGDNLRWVIARNQIASTIMIGDAQGDESAAVACGVPFAFVTYGFGSCTDPMYRFDSFDELMATFLPAKV